MPHAFRLLTFAMLLTPPLLAQGKRLWVLRASGEMVEYDPATFALKQTVKLPAEALKNPTAIEVNHLGQILFASPVSLPLSDEDAASPHKIWFWNGNGATTIDAGVEHKVEDRGSNQAITESAPVAFLSADGKRLFWFTNESRRLQREGVDLSILTTWQASETDTSGGNRQDLASLKFSDCRCQTGNCEETCPYGVVWGPASGIDTFFVMNQFIAGQTESTYKSSTLYQENAGQWTAKPLPQPLQRVLDASADGSIIVHAIPDIGCCGWANQSNDQTLVLTKDKTLTVFDELASYKNPDYDVSFYTSNALLSPGLGHVAITIVATTEANKPIQLAEQGQANPEESQRIRKSLAELPAVEVKTLDDPGRHIAFVPHTSLVGWLSEKELLIVEEHLLVVYNIATGARRRSSVRVQDSSRVFLR